MQVIKNKANNIAKKMFRNRNQTAGTTECEIYLLLSVLEAGSSFQFESHSLGLETGNKMCERRCQR